MARLPAHSPAPAGDTVIAAALAAAVFSLSQPEKPCALGLSVGAGGPVRVVNGQPVDGPVLRGSTVDFIVAVYNNGPDTYSAVTLLLRIDSNQRVARMDGMTVEIAEDGGAWRRLDRGPDAPDYSFTAPVATFPLSVGGARNLQVRMHLDPAQPGSVKPGAALVVPASGCVVRAGFDLDVRPPDRVPQPPSRWPLALGVLSGAVPVVVLYWLLIRWRSRRQPSRLARRARS